MSIGDTLVLIDYGLKGSAILPKVSGSGADGVQSVMLAMRIIESLAEASDPVGVTELANKLNTTKSRIFRHLRTLVEEDYLSQSPHSERYRVGPRLIALARSLIPNQDFLSIAVGTTKELRDKIGHSCVIGRVDDDGVRVVLTVAGKSSIEIGVRQGSVLPFHASAQGKIALAYCDEATRESMLSGDLEMLTPNTIVDPIELREQLRIVRARGWATAPDEIAIGLNSLAYPVLGANEEVVATLAAVSLTQFIPSRPDAELQEHMRAAAAKISSDLGYRGIEFQRISARQTICA